MLPATPTPLSPAQVDHFRTEGFVIVPDVFDPADLEPLRREMAAEIDRKARALHGEGRLTELHADLDFDRRLVALHRDSPENGEAIMRHLEGSRGGGFHREAMFNVMQHPRLLAKVASLVASEEIVASSVFRLRPKLPNIGRGIVPWHQDSGYFQAHCDEHLIVTCWIPLVDATVENGCMRILPRVHRRGIVPHHRGGNAGFLVIKDNDLPDDPAKAVTAACPRGGVVFMTNLTPHCSTPNTSDHIRWSIDLRYQSAEAPNNVGLWPSLDDDHDAPGSDWARNVNVACYPPEADFLIHSRARPEAVADYAAFVRRRESFDRVTGIPSPRRGWAPVTA